MSTQKKYEFTGETKELSGRTLRQIRALAAIPSIGVAAGDVGGWIEAEKNLSQDSNAWVSGDARISGNAEIYGNARIYGNAEIYGDALIYGNARIYGNALIYGNARIYGDAEIYGNAECLWFTKVGSENGTLTVCRSKTGIWVSRGCFSGSLDQFEAAVKKAHGDNQTAKEYALLIEFIKLRATAWKPRETDQQEAAA